MIINYFPHDSNARSDNRIIALRMRHGWAGYGLFWALVEKLRDSSDYRLAADFDALAYDLRTESDLLRSIVSDFGLFALDDDGRFSSPSLLRRMEIKDDRSARSREAALTRWRRERCVDNADALPATSDGTAGAIPEKEKETKPDKTKPKSLSAPSDSGRKETERAIFEVFLRERKLVTARPETKRLLDYYDSRGWQTGKTRITDPAAAARLWDPRPLPAALPPPAAATLEALYRTMCRDGDFDWQQFAISGGRYDELSNKLLLSCTRAFGLRADTLREPIIDAVRTAGGVGFKLIYNDEKPTNPC